MIGKKRRHVVLDIGTTKVLLVVVDVVQRGGSVAELHIAGVGRSTSLGIRKGLVTHIDGATRAVNEAVRQAESMVDTPISKAVVNVSGAVVRGFNSYGIVGIADREVSPLDVERVLDAARAVVLPAEQRIVHLVPQGFSVDQHERTRSPLGMAGVRLESRVHILASSKNAMDNLIRVVNGCNVTVSRLVASPYMSALGALTFEERQLGSLVIDFGGGTCDVCLFRAGVVESTFVVAIGGNHITNDIAAGLRTPIVSAEEIKREYGSVLSVDGYSHDTAIDAIEVTSSGGHSPRIVSHSILSSIIEARVREVFEIVKNRLAEEKVDLTNLAGGVVLTGGSSALHGIGDLAEQVFGCPARCLGESINGRELYSHGLLRGASEFDTEAHPTSTGSYGIGAFGVAQENSRFDGIEPGVEVTGLFNLLEGAESSVVVGMLMHCLQDGNKEMSASEGLVTKAMRNFGAWLSAHF
jgi:cell division protein FtsA